MRHQVRTWSRLGLDLRARLNQPFNKSVSSSPSSPEWAAITLWRTKLISHAITAPAKDACPKRRTFMTLPGSGGDDATARDWATLRNLREINFPRAKYSKWYDRLYPWRVRLRSLCEKLVRFAGRLATWLNLVFNAIIAIIIMLIAFLF
jgi:hypothetical protein